MQLRFRPSARPRAAPAFAAFRQVPANQPQPASAMTIKTVAGVSILGPVTPEHAQVLTPEAQQFLATLHRCFNGR